MLVSILITNYNKGEFLEEAILSALDQRFDDFEVVVIDDGSTDNSIEIIKKFESRDNFRFLLKSNEGVIKTRNKGIEFCEGKYILQLDGDDKLGEYYLAKTVEILENDPGVGIAYCKTAFFGEKEGVWELGDYTIEKQLVTNQIVITSLFRKEDFYKVGGYSEEFNEGYEDWDFWLSIIELGRKVVKIEDVQFFYRILNGSRNASIINLSAIKQKIWKRHNKLYEENFKDPVNLLWEMEVQKMEMRELERKVSSPEYELGKILLWIPRFIQKLISK